MLCCIQFDSTMFNFAFFSQFVCLSVYWSRIHSDPAIKRRFFLRLPLGRASKNLLDFLGDMSPTLCPPRPSLSANIGDKKVKSNTFLHFFYIFLISPKSQGMVFTPSLMQIHNISLGIESKINQIDRKQIPCMTIKCHILFFYKQTFVITLPLQRV